MLNPELFSITQSKEMGLWPPSDIVAHGIWPYIKRLKESNLVVLDVGIMKGENAVYLLEKDTEKKIKTIYGIISFEKAKEEEFKYCDELLKRNVEGLDRVSTNYNNEPAHVVCIHANSDLDSNLEKYYTAVKSGGIFCGNEHHLSKVKVALSNFRRQNKIGTPIMVSNGCWLWIKR